MATTGAPTARNVWTALIGGSIGNLIEWYDWFVYSTFSVYFASAFFPKGNPTAQLLNTAGIFAVGFFMRPVGGWLLGRLGDRKGRKAALTTSVTMMTASALLIAVAPTYARVGYFGALVLLLARLLQGLSIGGEYAASAAYLSEASKPGKRGFLSSFQMVFMKVGQLFGLAMQIILQHSMSDHTLHFWGWRIPFVFGAFAAAGIYYMRRKMLETEAFDQDDTARRERGTLRALFTYKREFLLVVGFSMGGTLCDYMYSTYMTKYLSNTAGLSKDTAALVSFCAIVVFIFLQPLAGALSDRIGRRPLLIFFGVTSTLGTVPLMTALRSVHGFGDALVLMVVGLVIITGYTSISGVVKTELFPTAVRTLGVALPYAIANALFGGSAEYVGLWFKHAGIESAFFWYASGCCAISLVVYIAMRETRNVAFFHRDRTSEQVDA
ncbi:MFS transporter [Nocardia jiangxiensis]|uniref:MFS transporter n=1 Tax=Nocardia jiangxiensis TaxID=282685 RepID=UPI00030F2755|nr:MFS transporter [Nocardia jiangxiensis]